MSATFKAIEGDMPKANKTEGTPPKMGPKYGMRLVIPQMTPIIKA